MCGFLNSVCFLLLRDTLKYTNYPLAVHVRVFQIPPVEAEVTRQHHLGSLPDLNWHREKHFPLFGDL